MKVFLDTNVWLSAVVFAGLCEALLAQCADNDWLVTTPLVREEAREVLERKFPTCLWRRLCLTKSGAPPSAFKMWLNRLTITMPAWSQPRRLLGRTFLSRATVAYWLGLLQGR